MEDPDLLVSYPPVEHRHGLSSSILGLKFVLRADHFNEGLMRVKCVACILPVLWQGERERAVQSLPVREMREALLLGEWFRKPYCSGSSRYIYISARVRGSLAHVYLLIREVLRLMAKIHSNVALCGVAICINSGFVKIMRLRRNSGDRATTTPLQTQSAPLALLY